MYDNTPSTVAMTFRVRFRCGSIVIVLLQGASAERGHWWPATEACMDHASIRYPVFVQWVTAADGLGEVVVL